ncbi:MAG TPA: hydroxyphenylacetyl-CoA thioesterase PaaI [Actinomycetes bacterium]|nr:hydroxyphenylacetyl-CoA thioesterase PaaI [Actinomycetes bacterium]
MVDVAPLTGLTDPDEIARLSAEVMLAGDRASAGAGVTLVDVGPGRATATMTVRPDMVNGHSIAHGGFVFLLADTAFAVACNSYGRNTVAAGCDIAFVAPVKAGDVLTAEAHERHRSGRSGLYDVSVRRADGTVVAELRGRSRTIAGTLVPLPEEQG